MDSTSTTPTPKKRGPKHKPAEQHHIPRLYKHAPDVAAMLDALPKGTRSKEVDEAIRQYFKKKEEKRAIVT